jgi:hypothetical protein
LKSGYILASETTDIGFWKIGLKLLPEIAAKFRTHARCPICGQLAICLFGRLVMTSKSDEIDEDTFADFHDAFLSAHRPTFATALFLCRVLIPRLPSLTRELVSVDFVSPALVSAIDAVIHEVKGSLPADRRELFEIEAFGALHRFFIKFPTPETCDLLYRLGLRNADPASFFFSRLPNSTPNFPVLFAFLYDTFKKLPDNSKAAVRVVIGATTYTPASRDSAMKLIAVPASDDRLLSLALAGAETDDIAAIRCCIARDAK